MMTWDHIRVVLTLYREKTISQAARTLGVSQITVRRQLNALESIYGAKLFDRVNNELIPTTTGSVFLERARLAEKEILSLHEDLSGASTSLSGLVRITAVESVLVNFLLPRLDAFYSVYPDISLELIGSQRNLSFEKKEVDIALRLKRPDSGTVLIKKLGDIQYGVYGSIAKFPDGEADLEHEPWVSEPDSVSHIPEVQWKYKNIKSPKFVLKTNTPAVMSGAVRNGLGIGVFGRYWADKDDKLIRLTKQESLFDRELWMLVDPDIRHTARIDAVCKWLENETEFLR